MAQMALPDTRPVPGFAGLPPEYAIPQVGPSLEEARVFCRRLTTTHYENFSVVTWFLPKRLHQHFYNLYAYCRISDDLGDEVGDPQLSLRLLDAWESELNACYDARPRHPVFVALAETVRELDIPRKPFSDLLVAFRQDQTVTRYPTFEDLLGYCLNSANPVGRLVLYICGYRDEERQRLSDQTCTALQLANFWQDVVPDYAKGRIYLPLEDLHRFGVTEQQIANRQCNQQFVELMRFEVQRAREWFDRGLPLARVVDSELAIDIELFTRGGQEILNAIERQGYDILTSRPALSSRRKLMLLGRAALRRLF